MHYYMIVLFLNLYPSLLRVPPLLLRLFSFFSIYFFPIILISRSSLIPVLSNTFSLTFSINISISFELASPLFIKKLQCFSDNLAPPILKFSQPDCLISSQAFLLIGFLNVLPQVFILFGWLIFFCSIYWIKV